MNMAEERKTWRPEGWPNKKPNKHDTEDIVAYEAFESGASAMLEELKNQYGQHQTCIDQFDKEKPFTSGIGWLVFIPEEK